MYRGFVVDPDQKKFLKKKLEGDNILLGAAGTGKTNLAIAKTIALSYQENPGDILFVSFTNALINTCKNDIIDLFASSALFDNPTVRITTFHKLISDIHEEVTGRRIKYLEKHRGFVRRALMDCIDSYPEGQLEYIKDLDVFVDEIIFLESFNITSLEEYENVVRSNRRVKVIRKNARKYYWYVYRRYQELVHKFYDCDFVGAGQYFLNFRQNKDIQRYKNIFIDEGQDFPPAALKAIMTLLDDNGTVLFLGDATQEIYGSRLSWKSLGLTVNNKIVRLQKNFRNSIEIGMFATDILESNKWEDETGEILYPKDMIGHGRKPTIIKVDSQSQSKNAIIEYIKRHDSESICVLFYSKSDVVSFSSILKSLNIEVQNTVSKDFTSHKKVTVSTFYSVKGLEFDTVILANFNSKFLDSIDYISKDNKEEIISLATKLFYVATTRAKLNLLIFYDDDLPCVFPYNSDYYESIPFKNVAEITSKDNPIKVVQVVKEMTKNTFLDKKDMIFKLQTALLKAEKELDIQSPWITSRVVDDLFLDKLGRLLERGVTVKITYGIADDANTKHKNITTNVLVNTLNEKFKKYKNFKLKKGNSHSKILLCDDSFAVIGSFNWLSYDGKSDREESGSLIIDKTEISEMRSRIFNF